MATKYQESGPKQQWLDTINADLKTAGIHPDQLHNRTLWRQKISKADPAAKPENTKKKKKFYGSSSFDARSYKQGSQLRCRYNKVQLHTYEVWCAPSSKEGPDRMATATY
ncbi:hypothetical protein ANCCAN_10432 [Ancylostoma caninum]|uniref:Uncharacterized protein n=1 Tax=Ancylostoma caninum TaxID=29170 RepID=A0A368GJZ3_ANCCA|nr:hypothetical protein ANCCAN_10432 [Ancylostoma caninum]